MSDTKENLMRVSAMAATMIKAGEEVVALEAQLKEAQAAYRRMEQEDLPDLMREVGLPEIVLADGTRIKLVEDVICGISDETRAAAFAWLREHNFDGIIKSNLTLTYGRGEDAKMREAQEFIAERLGIKPEASASVHYQTLKAFIKERRAAAGLEPESVPPDELFGVFPFTRADVKLPAGRVAPSKPKFARK
jgi:hypothetical protein